MPQEGPAHCAGGRVLQAQRLEPGGRREGGEEGVALALVAAAGELVQLAGVLRRAPPDQVEGGRAFFDVRVDQEPLG